MKIDLNEEASFTFGFASFFIAIASVAMFGCHQCEETNREKERTTQEAMKSGMVQKPEMAESVIVWTRP